MDFQDTFERKEVKYLMTDEQYQALRERLEGFAEVDQYGLTTIYNIYFDTPDFRLIRESLDKPVYKEKLRLRSYGIPTDDSLSFVEIKKKYKGIVYKRRIGMSYSEAIEYLCHGRPAPEKSQISDEIDYFLLIHRGIIPTMVISYDRIAMAGVEDPQMRLTFDTDLRWSTEVLDLRGGKTGRQILQPGVHLMEVKIGDAMDLRLAHMLSELEIFPTSISKYGQGFLQYEALQTKRHIDLTQQGEITKENAISSFTKDWKRRIPSKGKKILIPQAG